jgi:hypothetical protein
VPTECNPTMFEFAPVEGHQVVASFDGGAITSDAGALLLGETDRVSGKCSSGRSGGSDCLRPDERIWFTIAMATTGDPV